MLKMIAFIIFALAFFVRVYNLFLFSLNHDEATWTLPSIEYFDRFLGIPVACFQGYIQPFFSYLILFTKKIFSSPEYIVRMPAVIIGVATVALIYQLAKEMYGKKTGLISSLLLCFLPWHVIQSRIGVSLILTPFFGCLIFYALFRSIQKQSNLWFLLSWLFLGIGSFYTYQASLLFVLIFPVTLLFLWKELDWLKPWIFVAGILIFIITLYPILHLQISGRIDFLDSFYRSYHKNPFSETPVFNLFQNFKGNYLISFKSLFLSSDGRILYAAAFHYPLLINLITLLLILFSLFVSLRKREAADKIIFIWLGLGLMGGVSLVSCFQPRYIIIILVPLLFLIARLISKIFNLATKASFIKQKLLFWSGTLILVWLVFAEITQLANYYIVAPFDLEECRRNSYGCQEAALFLSKMPGIENCNVVCDARMTIDAYLKYYRSKNKKRILPSTNCVYYIFWAPESHPKEYWDGLFWYGHQSFKQEYPKQMPIKTIYYPDGLAAINIFKVEEDSEIWK